MRDEETAGLSCWEAEEVPDSMADESPFVLIHRADELPHRFRAYRYHRSEDECWQSVVEGCLQAWRIQADAYFAVATEDTGFSSSVLGRTLTDLGCSQLPPTPPEDENVTRAPAITDVTEVLALRALEILEDDLTFPYPRVLHKESYPVQHRGIDLIAYRRDADGYLLYVVEVMASAQGPDVHPPQTVTDHRSQLLEGTLDAPNALRLLAELSYVHDEAEDEHKTILNGFILAVYDGSLGRGQGVFAVPVLVRKLHHFGEDDWTPFRDHRGSFENAAIPAVLLALCIECHDSYSGLMDLIKESADGQGTLSPDRGG